MKLSDLTYDPELFCWYIVRPDQRFVYQIAPDGKAFAIMRRDALNFTPWEIVQTDFISPEAAAAHLVLDDTPFLVS